MSVSSFLRIQQVHKHQFTVRGTVAHSSKTFIPLLGYDTGSPTSKEVAGSFFLGYKDLHTPHGTWARQPPNSRMRLRTTRSVSEKLYVGGAVRAIRFQSRTVRYSIYVPRLFYNTSQTSRVVWEVAPGNEASDCGIQTTARLTYTPSYKQIEDEVELTLHQKYSANCYNCEFLRF